jgi:hypothetical protein
MSEKMTDYYDGNDRRKAEMIESLKHEWCGWSDTKFVSDLRGKSREWRDSIVEDAKKEDLFTRIVLGDRFALDNFKEGWRSSFESWLEKKRDALRKAFDERRELGDSFQDAIVIAVRLVYELPLNDGAACEDTWKEDCLEHPVDFATYVVAFGFVDAVVDVYLEEQREKYVEEKYEDVEEEDTTEDGVSGFGGRWMTDEEAEAALTLIRAASRWFAYRIQKSESGLPFGTTESRQQEACQEVMVGLSFLLHESNIDCGMASAVGAAINAAVDGGYRAAYQRLREDQDKTCVLCGEEFTEFGNNPAPLKSLDEGRCCDKCNWEKVMPTRFAALGGK